MRPISHPDGGEEPPDVTEIERVIIRTADIEVSCGVHSVAWTRDELVEDGHERELVIDPEGMPDWLEELIG